MATRQEIFDKIYTHLVTQGKQAMDDTETCRYRTDEGLMCAVGVLLDPAVYDEELEGMLMDSPAVMAEGEWHPLYKALRESKIRESQFDILWRMQGIHDDCLCWDDDGFSEAGHRAVEDAAKDLKVIYKRPN